MVVLSWNLLALITCTLPQWAEEKWAGGTLGVDKMKYLTHGNGHLYIIVFISSKGFWDLEKLVTGISVPNIYL
jgi:hypothetical protein